MNGEAQPNKIVNNGQNFMYHTNKDANSINSSSKNGNNAEQTQSAYFMQKPA